MRPSFKGLLAELTPAWLRRNGSPGQFREPPTNVEAGKRRPEPTVNRPRGAYRPPPPRIDDITHTL
jgi:hypothetical protein